MQDYSNTRFLIVDDFSDFRTSLKGMLRDIGAKDIDMADRGEDALKLCAHKRYDIILHDYNLGAGNPLEEVPLPSALVARSDARVMDAATASRSMLVELGTGDWDGELMRLFDLDGEQMPAIVGNDEIIGTTTMFGAQMPVGGVILDQQAALLAQACLNPGMAKCTLGTGAFLLANTGTAGVRSTAGLTSSVAWRTAGTDTFCVDGQVYTAASAVRWLSSLGVLDSAEEIDAVAADDAGGVFCVPAFAGLAAPWWKPEATATLAGMTLSTERGHLVLAVLQGIAAQIAELVTAIDADAPTPLNRLRVDGGLTRSVALMQACADIIGVPVDVYPSPHATALGAAALARLSLDPSRALASVVGDWTASATYEPRWTVSRAAEFRQHWRDLAAVS